MWHGDAEASAAEVRTALKHLGAAEAGSMAEQSMENPGR